VLVALEVLEILLTLAAQLVLIQFFLLSSLMAVEVVAVTQLALKL
jgi:hypothetical protein